MIGNNSCGVHGLLGGKVVGQRRVHGHRALRRHAHDRRPHHPGTNRRLIRAGGRVGEIYAASSICAIAMCDLIREKFPRIPRRVSGYNLDELLPENGFNVARALVGSEGTCVTVLSATLNLTSSPPFRVLTALAFDDRISRRRRGAARARIRPHWS